MTEDLYLWGVHYSLVIFDLLHPIKLAQFIVTHRYFLLSEYVRVGMQLLV